METRDQADRDNLSNCGRQRATLLPPSTPILPASDAHTSEVMECDIRRDHTNTSESLGGVVDLAKYSSCEPDHAYESQVDAIVKRLELPEGSSDYLKTDARTKHLLSTLYTNMESEIKTLQSQNLGLKHDSEMYKADARTWQFRYCATNDILDSKTLALRMIDQENEALKSALSAAEDKSEDKEHELQLSRQENQRLLSENLQKDVELQTRVSETTDAEQETEQSRPEQVVACPFFSRAAENEHIDINETRDANNHEFHQEGITTQLQARNDDRENLEHLVSHLQTTHAAEILELQEEIRNLNEKLQISNQERDELEETCIHLEFTHAYFGKKVYKWGEDKKKMQKQAADNRKSLKSAQKKHEEEKSELETIIDDERSDFLTREEEWNEARAKLLADLRDSQGLAQQHNFKLSDGDVLERWSSLKGKIVQFVDSYTGSMSNETPQCLKSVLEDLSPKASDFFQNPLLRPFVFEAYIWTWLTRAIFAPHSCAWAGSLGQQFNHLSESARTLVRTPNDSMMGEYHKWRSSSSNLLSRLSESNVDFESFNLEVNTLVDGLAELCTLDEVEKGNSLADLTSIVTDARAFDIERRKLRANIIILFGLEQNDGSLITSGFSLDDNIMKNITPRVGGRQPQAAIPGPVVMLCVSPTLIRCGNSQGSNYDTQEIIAKMHVLCDRAGPAHNVLPQPSAELENTQVISSGHETQRDGVFHPHYIQSPEQIMVNQEGIAVESHASNTKCEAQSTIKIYGHLEAEIVDEREQENRLRIDGIVPANNPLSSSLIAQSSPVHLTVENGSDRSYRRSLRSQAVAAKRPHIPDSAEESVDELSMPGGSQAKNTFMDHRRNKKLKKNTDSSPENKM